MIKRFAVALILAVLAVLAVPVIFSSHGLARASHAPAHRSHRVALALPCQAANLSASVTWQGATGSLAGSLILVNRGGASCSVIGRPTVLLLANGDEILPVAITVPSSTITHFSFTVPGTFTVAPQGSAVVSLQWFNWCGPRPKTLGLVYALPAGGGGRVIPLLRSPGSPALATPRCDNTAIPSHLDVGLFRRPAT
jgi:hypothetical protein